MGYNSSGGGVIQAEDIKTKLAVAEKKKNITFFSPERRPLITFIDDDGNSEVITELLPLFNTKGIKGSCAIITGKIGTAGFMTEANLQTLKTAEWEMLGHGNNYTDNLTEFTDDDDLDYQLGDGCKKWLEDRGFTVNGFVYPQGTSDARIRRFTKKHYTYSFAVGYAIENGDYIGSMGIRRIALGSFTSSNPTVGGNSEKSTLNYYKACVDDAVANDGWLIFMTHVANVDMDATQWQHLSDVIDYIKSLNVEIVTPAEAYEAFGNKIFIGDMASDYFLLNESGMFYSPGFGLPHKKIDDDSMLLSHGITDFQQNAVSFMKVTTAYAAANGFPDSYGGTLFTYYHDTGNVNYNRQIYWANGAHKTYIRYPAGSSTWSDWLELSTVNVNGTLNAYTAATTPNSFPNKQVTVFYVNSSGATGFPDNAAGICTTTRLGGNGWNRQRFEKYDTDEVWARHADASTGAWTAWVKISAV